MSALFYVDDETVDDVNYNKHPFETISRIMNTVINYVNQSKHTKGMEEIKNFSFLSSTKRKDALYERYAKRIIEQLNGDWDYSNYDGQFYFFKKQ